MSKSNESSHRDRSDLKLRKVKGDLKHKKNIKKKKNELKYSQNATTLDRSSEPSLATEDESHISKGSEITSERLQRTVFVGNLPLDISKKTLTNFFNKALKDDPKAVASNCVVESVRFRGVVPATGGLGKLARKRAAIHREISGVSKFLIAYVVLSSKVGIQTVLGLNGHWLNSKSVIDQSSISHSTEQDVNQPHLSGRHIRVDRAIPNRNRDSIDSGVFLGNLPFDCTEEEVRSALLTFGQISNVRLVRDRETGAVRGFGFVEFVDSSVISLAIRGSNSVSIRGRPVRIQEWQQDGSRACSAIQKQDTPSTKLRSNSWLKLDQRGQVKGITLPSNLHGVQRRRALEKKLSKKMKRKIRRSKEKGIL